MLAKTPAPQATENYDLLKVPARPASLVDAERAWQDAVIACDAGRALHVGAARLLRSQVPGMPPQITSREVDEIGARLTELFATEEQARNACDAERKNYETATIAPLMRGLAMLSDAIGRKVDEIDRLLDHGFRVDAEIRTARIKLPNSIVPRVMSVRRQLESIRLLLRSSRS